VGILDEDVARVREATNIVAVVSEHLALKRVGRRYQGLCPFHSEKTPSFSVNPELGLYHCFGCGVGGDAIRFVREIEHLDFATAVERLAAKAGITLRYDDAAVTRDRQRRDRLVEATAASS
jgi:DNA primase